MFGTSLDKFHMINTQGAVVLGMVYNFLPFMVLPIFSVIEKIDPKVIEAAQDLGANTAMVFRRVIFPLSLPGVLSGVTMVFIPSVSTFVISRLLGGGKTLLLGDLIEMQFLGNAYNPHLGSRHLPGDDGHCSGVHGHHEPLRRGRRGGGGAAVKKNGVFSRLFMGLVFLFLYAPIFVLIVFSFNAAKSNRVWEGFSLHWYAGAVSEHAAC